MALRHAPRIVTDGLVLALDAANPKSYPGSSTTWRDLSGQGNNGTLVNGVEFNGSNRETMRFDGVDDYATVPTNSSLSITNLTVLAWFYIQTFPNFSQYRIINCQQTTVNAWGLQMGRGDYVGGGTSSNIRLFCHSNNGITAKNLSSPTNLLTQTWYQGGFSNDGLTLKIYLNGALSNSTASLGNQYQPINSSVDIGVSSQFKNAFFWHGDIANVQIYNRALSAEEVLQNYNATKSRFYDI